jgi:hypothetical protein
MRGNPEAGSQRRTIIKHIFNSLALLKANHRLNP